MASSGKDILYSVWMSPILLSAHHLCTQLAFNGDEEEDRHGHDACWSGDQEGDDDISGFSGVGGWDWVFRSLYVWEETQIIAATNDR